MKQQPDVLVVDHAEMILPDGIQERASMRIENGRIVQIGRMRAARHMKRIDAAGCYVLPGIIDLHSDALEKELEPRPNTRFPTDMVLLEMDKKLAACGITTMYHAISFAEGEIGIRSNKMAESIVRDIHLLSAMLRVRTRVHVRCELTDEAAMPVLEALIEERKVDLMSFMDHTPGQGQFRDDRSYHRYFQAVYHRTDEEISETIKRKRSARTSVGRHLDALIRRCIRLGIPMASHDDDSSDKIEGLRQKGIAISEFPVNMDAASAAARNNLYVCLGAPNALRGHSQAGNLSAREAITAGVCHVLCSDYAPMTLLHAAFKLSDLGLLPLHEAIRLITLNPARAAGIDQHRGSLEEGKAADLIIVNKQNSHAQVLKTFVAGQEVYSTCLKT